MEIFQSIVLALVQGVTEFLPVSSSAHLVLVRDWLGWRGEHLAFDITVHAGTLCAVIVHCRRQLAAMLRACLPRAPRDDENLRLLAAVAVASLPVLAAGWWFEPLIRTHLRTMPVIAAATAGFALALWLADARRTGGAREVTLSGAVWIGLAQALALVPGASRAGVVITAGLLLGLARTQAAQFSFLLAIPVILAAAALQALQLAQDVHAGTAPAAALAAGFAVSALFALATMQLFIRFVEKIGLLPFVLYRLLLGALLFGLLLL